jgi:hypothetical protein
MERWDRTNDKGSKSMIELRNISKTYAKAAQKPSIPAPSEYLRETSMDSRPN